MNELQVIDNKKIENMIYEIRGKQVMFSNDIAKIYNVETKRINEIVKRNKNRFPEEFCFQVTEEEYKLLRSQIATSMDKNSVHNKGRNRYLQYVFSEHGIIMLSGLLKSEAAVKINNVVIKAFVAMKKFISSNLLEQKFINNMSFEHDERIKLLEDNFTNKTFSNEIFYEGQIYDAHSLLLDIFNTSIDSIIIIDNYADKNLFDILCKTKKKVTIYSKNIDNNLINKYKSEYNNVTLINNNSFHDIFIIINNKTLLSRI